MLDIAVSGLLGIPIGYAVWRLSVWQVRQRTDNADYIANITKKRVPVLWSILSAALFAVAAWRVGDILQRIEFLLYISVAIDIAAVDITVRKIPNQSLLALMAVKLIFTVVSLFRGVPAKEALLTPFLGLAVGLVVFILPSIFHIPVGAGDTKYCAVIGFCLGIYGYLEAMIVMALAEFIYFIYLVVTKKGGYMTLTAMGPYLSLGAVISLLFPIQQFITTLANNQ